MTIEIFQVSSWLLYAGLVQVALYLWLKMNSMLVCKILTLVLQGFCKVYWYKLVFFLNPKTCSNVHRDVLGYLD